MPAEAHIASLVVRARPEAAGAVARRIGDVPGAEVHGQGALGKLVVTLEASDEADLLIQINAVRALMGVLSAELVYHEVDAASAAEGGREPCR